MKLFDVIHSEIVFMNRNSSFSTFKMLHTWNIGVLKTKPGKNGITDFCAVLGMICKIEYFKNMIGKMQIWLLNKRFILEEV